MRWASRVRVQNTSSYAAGPPPRGRKIHPFFRRSIPGRPALPPPSLSAPNAFLRSTLISSCFLRRTSTSAMLSWSHPRLRRKVPLLHRFLPRWRHLRRQEPPFRSPRLLLQRYANHSFAYHSSVRYSLYLFLDFILFCRNLIEYECVHPGTRVHPCTRACK